MQYYKVGNIYYCITPGGILYSYCDGKWELLSSFCLLYIDMEVCGQSITRLNLAIAGIPEYDNAIAH